MTYIYNISRILLQEKIKKVGAYLHGDVLDVGSGSYERYRHLFKCDSVLHFDVVDGPNVDVIGSADKMPFDDNKFDSVLSTQVFEHLEYPEKAAQEIYRVLKPGGVLLLTVPQWNELHEEPHDYWRYTCFGIRSLFERNGFTVISCEQYGGFFANRAQITMRYLIDKFCLYDSKFRRVVSLMFKFWGKIALFLDEKDESHANRKHAIGWVCVLKK